jgi:hypothetical protein
MVIGLCGSRLFVAPIGSEPNGMAYIGYMIENFALLSVAGFYVTKFFNKKVLLNAGVLMWLVFYSYCILTAPLSEYPLLSMHLGIRGVLYVILGIVAWEYIRRSRNPILSFNYFIAACFFGMLLMIIIEYIARFNIAYVSSVGVGGSFIGLFGLLFIYSLYNNKQVVHSYVKRLAIFILAVFCFMLVLKINSLTSILAFIVGIVICGFRFRNLKVITLFIALLTIAVLFLLPMFISGEFLIANKSIDTITSGTGRFETWAVCYEQISNFDIPFIGVGFLADGSILKQYEGILTVTHTCHSSILSNIVGLGLFGFIFYVLFIFIHALQIVVLSPLSVFKEYTVIIFTSFIIFGWASLVYPGVATLLITVSVMMFLFNDKKLSQL